jgi:AAA15 family ATPase/GTPase
MENFINYVNIHNFKSVNHLKLEDCRRINLFIGYPNVGKSNVLEALSLFSVPFLRNRENLNKLVRTKSVFELFHSLVESCEINTNLNKIELKLSPNLKLGFHYIDKDEYEVCFYYNFTKDIRLTSTLSSSDLKAFSVMSNIKRYSFSQNIKGKSNNNCLL